eukprot:2529186-Rhodomonas_salina.4
MQHVLDIIALETTKESPSSTSKQQRRPGETSKFRSKCAEKQAYIARWLHETQKNPFRAQEPTRGPRNTTLRGQFARLAHKLAGLTSNLTLNRPPSGRAVSYTHLTLPTICSV